MKCFSRDLSETSHPVIKINSRNVSGAGRREESHTWSDLLDTDDGFQSGRGEEKEKEAREKRKERERGLRKAAGNRAH